MENRKTIVIPRGQDAYDALISNKRLFENYLVIGHKNFTMHLESIKGVTIQPLLKNDYWDIIYLDDIPLSAYFSRIAAIKYDERIGRR